MPTFVNLKTGEIKEVTATSGLSLPELDKLELVEDVPISKWVLLVKKMHGWLADLRDQNKDLIEAQEKLEKGSN